MIFKEFWFFVFVLLKNRMLKNRILKGKVVCFETGSLCVDQAGLLPGYHMESRFVGSALAPQDRSEETSQDAR